jgi:hypothetical protein
VDILRMYIKTLLDYGVHRIPLYPLRIAPNCRVIILYLLYHSVCSLVRLGSAHPLSCPPPRNRGGGQRSPADEGVGGPNSDDRRESLELCLRAPAYHLLFINCALQNSILPTLSKKRPIQCKVYRKRKV